MVAAIKLTDLQQLSHTSFNVKSFVGKIFTETDPQKTSLVPRPPPFFFALRFAFSIIHGSGRARKMGKAWSHPSHE